MPNSLPCTSTSLTLVIPIMSFRSYCVQYDRLKRVFLYAVLDHSLDNKLRDNFKTCLERVKPDTAEERGG